MRENRNSTDLLQEAEIDALGRSYKNTARVISSSSIDEYLDTVDRHIKHFEDVGNSYAVGVLNEKRREILAQRRYLIMKDRKKMGSNWTMQKRNFEKAVLWNAVYKIISSTRGHIQQQDEVNPTFDNVMRRALQQMEEMTCKELIRASRIRIMERVLIDERATFQKYGENEEQLASILESKMYFIAHKKTVDDTKAPEPDLSFESERSDS